MNDDFKNLTITIVLSVVVLITWQYFFETPRQQALQTKTKTLKTKLAQDNFMHKDLLQKQIVNTVPPVTISSDKLKGKIEAKGLRFNYLMLKDYKKTIANRSQNIELFNTYNNKDYFVQFGWLANDGTEVPDNNSIWKANQDVLRAGETIKFSWLNKQNILFECEISLDNDYMFSFKHNVINNSGKIISVKPFGLIYRSDIPVDKPMMVFHEGPIGVFDEILKERSYEDLVENKKEKYSSQNGGWLGFADKYWLAAIILDKSKQFNSNFVGTEKGEKQRFQVDFVGANLNVNPRDKISYTNYLFAGAKVADIINHYEQEYDIPLFDRAIDYGWFYFLTKPMFYLLSYLFTLVNNFGLAILLMTFLVKIVMFPVANKSFKTMQQMKTLQPKITALKKQHGNDQMAMNKAMMDLYKNEKMNPLSGCLPMILQIPVFFSLYKVIFISIEMRHAPFYGWIKDLSAADPTNIFNFFGLLPYDTPTFLAVGAWPIIMGLTMFLQQRMSPPPSDPVQANVMKFLPLIFVFAFQSFPAGLMLYWSCSNILSILQQWFINLKYANDKK